jgi:hypothetical protein
MRKGERERIEVEFVVRGKKNTHGGENGCSKFDHNNSSFLEE